MNAIPKIALAALATVGLSAFAARAEKVNLTFLTHWSPESVAMLEKAASAYAKERTDVAVSIRAVPFGDLLTTLRASGGGSGAPTMASIYNAWLPDLARDKLLAQIPEAVGTEVKADWPGASSALPLLAARSTASRMKSTSTPSTTTRSSSKPPG